MTRDKVITMAREAGAPDWWIGIGGGPATGWVSAIVEKAVAAERERICAAIKAEDDHCVTEGDYMLDSDDCIKVARGEWVRPDYSIEAYTPPPPTPEQLRINEMKRGILSRLVP